MILELRTTYDENNRYNHSEVDKTSAKENASIETKTKYKKPKRPCLICNIPQSRLKRHILTKHSNEVLVQPLLKMNSKEQDAQIALMRKQAIRTYNMTVLKAGENSFMRERQSKGEN